MLCVNTENHNLGNLGPLERTSLFEFKTCPPVAQNALWHEIIQKIIPWELFFVIFEGFCVLQTSRKDIRNFLQIVTSE